ncbi:MULTISPECIES: phytanoyl-CoA dioxygenase family protein [unclassified Sphingobium]|uniref:phytanoyl-CoA dioxygenase family protein n=1 Tax=unclassified Sphingobium TaxID=2611147 RepID=UPI000D165F9A|nr:MULTISPECIES: phytanoyl-CoA dioxygenase family protein [unclassified Sphingobium]MBG6120016.1 ectoine hydroxylase-related dioxygenase (phytanoyl-CoA dioxygenase family) [Sphingobium sp. JAI105]PSO12926.1 phytanoyl-CoA dioxygenase [Sphingobium sp. AEW4]TWD05783.1 ectoine hydroxylase-related dioxygenase (phytanoyl-CoA dioxygenase family) [Sphingobium sp. AEW010]TWD23336.1 ectoine hydroxylase-related dioxygenase (phytanoyl-CoA dioxygenase family) [Sphingobium sp. AEW013]TWD25196.1 ectoine hydr
MISQVINRPDAQDLSPTDVNPAGELQACNHLLDDHAALEKFYKANGYILLRGVLDPASVAEARDAMLSAAATLGLVEAGDITGKWTGKPSQGGLEESPLYEGIARRLLEHSANQALLEKVLGEPACAVPLVQYRTYPPGGAVGAVHQDGFYSPGIQDYKPVWVALTPCAREMGGLAVAVGQNHRGYFHNLGKPAPYPFPRDAVPDDSWATTDYMPGDVLIVHPHTPHCGLANRSDRLRVTFDSRVQSARNPSAIAATVKAVTPASVTVDVEGQGERTFSVDADTFIRVLHPGRREPFDSFADYTKAGMRLVVVRDGDRAVMLRKAAEG